MTANVLTWHLYLDWNNDGIYESDEGARVIGIQCERGQDLQMLDPMAGLCTVRLDNHDRRFDWWYSGSVLYPNTFVGKRAKLTVDYGSTTYNIFTGRIDVPVSQSIRAPDPLGGGEMAITTLTIHDGWQWFKDKKAHVDLTTNITVKDAVSEILVATSWGNPANVWVLGTSTLGVNTVLGGISSFDTDLGTHDGDTLPYWWSDAESADVNLFELAKCHFSRMYIGADGKFYFRTQSQINETASALTLTDDIIQELLVFQRVDEYFQKVTVAATPYELLASGDIWQLSTTPFIPAGETMIFYTTGSHDAATNQISPVATTDYTANTQSDGSGTDLTSSMTVALVVESSFSEKITVVNGSSSGAYLTLNKLRGQLVEAQDTVAQIATDPLAPDITREVTYTPRWLQDTLIAQDLADWVIGYHATTQNNLQVRFEHREDALQYELGTKILDGTTRGDTGKYFWLGKIAHECSGAGMQNLATTWTLFPLPQTTYWILGNASYSQLGTTTILGV
jgi:hypothetical protein